MYNQSSQPPNTWTRLAVLQQGQGQHYLQTHGSAEELGSPAGPEELQSWNGLCSGLWRAGKAGEQEKSFPFEPWNRCSDVPVCAHPFGACFAHLFMYMHTPTPPQGYTSPQPATFHKLQKKKTRKVKIKSLIVANSSQTNIRAAGRFCPRTIPTPRSERDDSSWSSFHSIIYKKQCSALP